VPDTTNAWLAPAGDLLWTPQQDILIKGVDITMNFGDYTTALAVAGANQAIHKVQVTTAGVYDADGAICQAVNSFMETLQGAITANTITPSQSVNKYVPLDDPVQVLEGNDVAVWQYQLNQLGSGINFDPALNPLKKALRGLFTP